MTTNVDMGGYRISNVAHPRDPSKKEYESDLVTAKILYDYMFKSDQNYMRRGRDGSLDRRLDMSNHRISGFADPTDADDAVTRRYVALSDEVQDKKSKLDALQNFLGVVNNQVLIREYEIIGSDFGRFITYGEEGRVTKVVFVKAPRPRDDTNEFGFIYIFTLKEYFFSSIRKTC